ncbi:unnamed protein product [Cochlearia groenlandica]
MAAGGVDFIRSSVAVKKDYDFNRNGTRDVYLQRSGRDDERRQIKRPNDNRQWLAPSQKKRRFSPIMWDAEHNAIAPSREKVNSPFTIPTTTNVITDQDVYMQRSGREEKRRQIKRPNDNRQWLAPSQKRRRFSPIMWDAEHNAIPPSRENINSPFTISTTTNVITDQDVDVTPVKPLEDQLSWKLHVDSLEEELVAQTPPFKTSRWGTDLTSPGEEVISHADNVPKTSRWNRSSLSPECGELTVSVLIAIHLDLVVDITA